MKKRTWNLVESIIPHIERIMILNRVVHFLRKVKKIFMKDTHTRQEIETKYMNELSILKDPNVGKDRKKDATKNAKRYEKLLKDVDFKEINGKEYPPKDMGYLSDKPMNKTEILKIINNTDTYEKNDKNCYLQGCYSTEGTYVPDPSGVSVGQNRFIAIDEDIDIRTHER